MSPRSLLTLLAALAVALAAIAAAAPASVAAVVFGADGKRGGAGANSWKLHMKTTPLTIKANSDKIKFAWKGTLPHDVVQVSASKFAACDTTGGTTLAPLALRGNKIIGPLAPGTYYYTCSVQGHCAAGQVLTVIAQ